MVIQLLELIHRNLGRVIDLEDPTDDNSAAGANAGSLLRAPGRFWRSKAKISAAPSEPSPAEIIEKVFLAVKEAIDRLQRLASAVRQVSTQNRYLKAANFVDKDDEGEDASSGFRQYAIFMVKRQHPNAPNSLSEQLGVTIFVGRNAFLYMRRHQKKLARERAQDIVLTSDQHPPADEVTPLPPRKQSGSIKSGIFSGASKLKSRSIKSAALSGTTVPVLPKGRLHPDIFERLDGPSGTSVAASGVTVLIKDSEFVYPSPPLFKPGEIECQCPY